jgi:hypothetical protein
MDRERRREISDLWIEALIERHDPYAGMEALMQEPAHGHNHGRAKGEGGGWHTLETDSPYLDPPSFKRFVDGTHKHGTAYLYVKLKCRCTACRAWNAARISRYRARM